jgi:hypothetical protein
MGTQPSSLLAPHNRVPKAPVLPSLSHHYGKKTLFMVAYCIAGQHTLIKNKIKFFLMYREIQSGAVAKSFMRKGFLIYEEMRKYFPIYEEAVSHL